MNNNMPNNFNNGTPSNGNNPISNAANEQLVGGQSAVGNGPSVMQGMPNVQNNPGAMQGVGSVPNNPNVMQGNPVPNQTPNTNSAIPGQNHSGVNAFTMQKEEVKKDTPEVVSIPNFASNISEPPKQPTPQPNVVQMPNVNNNIAAEMNQNINNSPLNSQVQKPEINQVNIPNMNPNIPNGNNNAINQPINQPTNILGQVNNQNLNGFPSNNINQMNGPKPQNTIGIVPPTSNNVNPVNNMPNNLNNGINEPKDLNDSMPSVNNENFNSGVSQIGSSEMDNDVVEMPEMPTKKFPLSTREMVLIGIALVGIVAVVIMYWPKG